MADPVKDALRVQIMDRLRKVPEWVAGADMQRIHAFKKFYAATARDASKPKATEASLRSLFNQVESMYR